MNSDDGMVRLDELHITADDVKREAEMDAMFHRFKNAWEEFQSDFMTAADFDGAHGGAWIISNARYEAARRKVNAVIGDWLTRSRSA